VVPRGSYERRLWYLIMPVVGAWLVLPILTGITSIGWLGLADWATDLVWVYALRWAAAVLGVTFYLLSVYCWLWMGRNWTMAVVPGQASQMITGGPYRWVRHPIYSLQVGLMLASVVVAPTVPMALLACLHFLGMSLKARHEEKHLAKCFGPAYLDYCQHVGRFWPRFGVQHGKETEAQEKRDAAA
jgi:protein-S-isoprenylcysteine O-methyltransferase Ste14